MPQAVPRAHPFGGIEANGGTARAMTRRPAGKLLADQLAVHGVDLVFCVPGESYLAVLDGLYGAPVKVLTCRHEAAAANMADAYGKLTGRPGVCFVTRGPGATHASVGVHTAFQDSTPVILFVGQVSSLHEDREGFQEIDYRRMFGQMSKWVAQIDHADRIPEYVARAFTVACSGRPGPVVLALPEDMLEEQSDANDARPFRSVQSSPSPEQIEELEARLARAERPLAILGGGGWTPRAASGIRRFIERNEIPAAAAFRRQDSLDNESSSYVGDVGFGINPKLKSRVREADLLLAIGPRLGEVTTQGYSMLTPPDSGQTLVHVHPGAEELGRVYHADMAILSGMEQFADAVGDLSTPSRWSRWTQQARSEYEAWQRHEPDDAPALDLAECVLQLRTRVPEAIVTNGAGNFALWLHRYWRYRSFPSGLAPTSGAMGYGLPAAIAAKAVAPASTVVCLAGDGDFLMSGQELATAAHHDLAIVVLIVNNGMYGTIRLHQERRYPGRPLATDLTNPDFAAYARSFGAHAESIHSTDEFPAALDRALGADRLAVIELHTDPGVLTPEVKLDGVGRPRDASGSTISEEVSQ